MYVVVHSNLKCAFFLFCMFYFQCIFKAGVDKSLVWVPEASRFNIQQRDNIPVMEGLDNIFKIRIMKGNSDKAEPSTVQCRTKTLCYFNVQVPRN